MADENSGGSQPKDVADEAQIEPKPVARKLYGDLRDFAGHYRSGPGWTPSFVAENAKHADGVLYHCPWERVADGFAEHSRRCARAMADAGVPVHLKGIGLVPWMSVGAGDRDIQDEFSDLLQQSVAKYVVQVHQCVPSEGVLEQLTKGEYWRAKGGMTLEELDYLNAHRVLSVVFEREKLTEEELLCMRRVGMIWAACEWNAQSLRDSGLTNVHVIPVPHYPNDPLIPLNGRPRDPSSPVRFYNIGKWEPRKEQRLILHAFMRAFKPRDCRLYIKTSPGSPRYAGTYPDRPEDAILAALDDPAVKANGWALENVEKSIFIIRTILPESKLVELHASCDVYVNMSRGEGYDMPAYDAKIAGNLMIHTPTGAPCDFHGEHDVIIEKTGVVECDPFYKWRKCHYIDYSFDRAVESLVEAREAVLSGKRCRGVDLTPWTAAFLGRKMRGLVEQLVQEPSWSKPIAP